MNIINQREIIKRMGEAGLFGPEALARALAGPVFVWNLPKEARQFSAEEVEYMEEVILEPGTGFPRLVPFPVFRLVTRSDFSLWFRTGKLAFSCFRYLAPGSEFNAFRKYDVVMEHSYQWMPEERGVGGELKRASRVEGGLAALIDWQPVDEGKIRASQGEDAGGFREMFLQPLNELRAFLFDLEYPGNVVLKAGPGERPGKSVEWRLARTHYCILRRGDARACQRQGAGPSEEQTVRAAHWRKAHFRRLKSEAFTKKRGQVVKVRHAWVGPSEWEGKDGKVYKVVSFS